MVEDEPDAVEEARELGCGEREEASLIGADEVGERLGEATFPQAKDEEGQSEEALRAQRDQQQEGEPQLSRVPERAITRQRSPATASGKKLCSVCV